MPQRSDHIFVISRTSANKLDIFFIKKIFKTSILGKNSSKYLDFFGIQSTYR